MPQPFPKHLKTCNFEVGTATRKRPDLCLMGMNIVTQYASLEITLSKMFIGLLGSNPGPSIAILSTIKNNNIRDAAFRAVAEGALAGERLEILNAVLDACAPADKERNRIAHWLWAIEDQLPDAVALVDPRKVAVVLQRTHIILDHRNPSLEEAVSARDILRDAALIYKAADFQSALSQVQQAMGLVIALAIWLSCEEGHPEGAKARKMLFDAPEIQKWLDRSKDSCHMDGAR